MAYGALGMASFTVLWTALTFLLVGPPFHYSEGQIGLVGIAGLAGAVAAQGAGRLHDRGLGRAATGAFWLLVAAGWALCELGATHIVVLLAGILIIDVGVQGQHITNQATIYALRPDARSRVTTAYMTGNFVVAALGSAAAAVAWDTGGWDAVCALGGATSLAALVVWAFELRRSAAVQAAQEA
jgi:predicted MFS family arabinose efflux permease